MGKKNQDFNTRLVHWIKERPVLYDPQHADYKDIEKSRAAWKEIAKVSFPLSKALLGKEIKMKVKELRSWWMSLRSGYLQYLRKLRSDSYKGRSKPYYLSNAMEFLKPFTNHSDSIRKQKAKISDSDSSSDESGSETSEDCIREGSDSASTDEYSDVSDGDSDDENEVCQGDNEECHHENGRNKDTTDVGSHDDINDDNNVGILEAQSALMNLPLNGDNEDDYDIEYYDAAVNKQERTITYNIRSKSKRQFTKDNRYNVTPVAKEGSESVNKLRIFKEGDKNKKRQISLNYSEVKRCKRSKSMNVSNSEAVEQTHTTSGTRPAKELFSLSKRHDCEPLVSTELEKDKPISSLVSMEGCPSLEKDISHIITLSDSESFSSASGETMINQEESSVPFKFKNKCKKIIKMDAEEQIVSLKEKYRTEFSVYTNVKHETPSKPQEPNDCQAKRGVQVQQDKSDDNFELILSEREHDCPKQEVDIEEEVGSKDYPRESDYPQQPQLKRNENTQGKNIDHGKPENSFGLLPVDYTTYQQANARRTRLLFIRSLIPEVMQLSDKQYKAFRKSLVEFLHYSGDP